MIRAKMFLVACGVTTEVPEFGPCEIHFGGNGVFLPEHCLLLRPSWKRDLCPRGRAQSGIAVSVDHRLESVFAACAWLQGSHAPEHYWASEPL